MIHQGVLFSSNCSLTRRFVMLSAKRSVVLVLLMFVLILGFVPQAEARDQTVTMYKGQTACYGVNEGDTLTVLYNPNGTPCTFVWWSNPVWYATHQPFTVGCVYGWAQRTGWLFYWQGFCNPWPFTTRYTIYLPSRTQSKVVFTNYRSGDFVYVQLK